MLTKSPVKREYGATLDQITEVIAAGEWPADEKPTSVAQPKNRRYHGAHRLEDVDLKFITRVAIPVSPDAR